MSSKPFTGPPSSCTICGATRARKLHANHYNNNDTTNTTSSLSSSSSIQLCGGCHKVGYCCRDHQMAHWKLEHKYQCPETKYIPGTKVLRTIPMAPNPLSGGPSAARHTTRGRTGKTMQDPLNAMLHFKYNKDGSKKVRLLKPGKYTPWINDDPMVLQQRHQQQHQHQQQNQQQRGGTHHHDNDDDNAHAPACNATIESNFDHATTPYIEHGNQQVRLINSNLHRHIASYSLEELRRMQWDGTMMNSTWTYPGEWVPFVCGYDSDPNHTYEPFDINIAKRSGIAGSPASDIGLYMRIPGETGLVRLNK